MHALVEDIYLRSLDLLHKQVKRMGVDEVVEASFELTDFVSVKDDYIGTIKDGIGKDVICLDFRFCLHILSSIGEDVDGIGDLMRDYRQIVFELYSNSQPVIGRVCSSYKLQPEAAEDFNQDLYLKLIYKLPLYDPDKASFDSWLSYLVSNVLANMYRENKKAISVGDSNMDSIVGDESVMMFTRDDVDRFYREACKCLDDEERLIVEAVFGVGDSKRMTYKEIAESIGGKPESVRVNKRPRVLEKLHKFATKSMVF